MTRPNITPGPWRPVEDAQGVCGLMHPKEEGIAVAWFSSAHHPANGYVGEAAPIIGYPERQANAQAIAALPDLLQALEKLTIAADNHDHWSTMDEVAEAKTALLKAGYTF